MPISELRGNVRKLKIANFRVLDVSYPAQKVVALLVHQEYAKELLERFEAAGVKPIENFDPSPGILDRRAN
jgi:NADH/NAD ratio-sensing transcriptional regulator Rex